MNHFDKKYLYPALPAIVVISLYAVTLGHGFVWDDLIYTVGNSSYEHIDISTLFISLGNGVEYLPLRDLSYSLDYLFWGWTPFGFHLTNLLLYAVTCTIIYLFTAALPCIAVEPGYRRAIAILTALIFAVHPLNSEAVNFITCRNVLLSGCFFFLAGYSFIRCRLAPGDAVSFPWTASLFICSAAAMLSKATAVTLPIVILLLGGYLSPGSSLRRRTFVIAPLFALAAVMYLVHTRVALQSRIIPRDAGTDIMATVAVAVQIPFFYLKKFLSPTGYSAEYTADRFSDIIAGSPVLLSMAGIILISAGAFAFRKRQPLAGFALLWSAGALLPVLNVFATNPVVADRYAFLPLYGFALMTAVLLVHFYRTFPRPAAVLVIAILTSLSTAAVIRSRDWHSDLTLWQANIRTEPANAKGYQNLAAEAALAGNLSLARDTLAQGRLNAPSPTYDYLEGTIYERLHDLPNALRLYKEAVRQDPDHIRSLLAIGRIYEESGNQDEAVLAYERTLSAEAPDGWGCRDQARSRLASLRPNRNERRR